MAVTKRLRYEILRRDNHACRYCGARAPEAQLVVDHVVPQALGGSDDPTNLATACEACNGGKSSTPPDAAIVADVSADARRWLAARAEAIALVAAEEDEKRAFLQWFYDRWACINEDEGQWLGTGWENSVLRLRAQGIDRPAFEDLMWVAATAGHVKYSKLFNYFVGCCHKRLERIQDRTAMLLAQQQAP